MKFQVGEVVIFAWSRGVGCGPLYVGQLARIVEMRAYAAGHVLNDGKQLEYDGDCCIKFADGHCAFPLFSQLSKLPPDDKHDFIPPETRKLFDGHKVKNPDKKPVAS